jgi:hypothetical protein
MSIEYKIQFELPPDYSPINLFKKLPSPIHRKTMTEIYGYKIEEDGFYFIDQLVDKNVASTALRAFIDEALLHTQSVQITEL